MSADEPGHRDFEWGSGGRGFKSPLPDRPKQLPHPEPWAVPSLTRTEATTLLRYVSACHWSYALQRSRN